MPFCSAGDELVKISKSLRTCLLFSGREKKASPATFQNLDEINQNIQKDINFPTSSNPSRYRILQQSYNQINSKIFQRHAKITRQKKNVFYHVDWETTLDDTEKMYESIIYTMNWTTRAVSDCLIRPLPASVNALLVNCAKAKNMKVTGIPF